MLEAKIRDVKKKGRSLRNLGLVTGTIKRKNGEIVPISMIGFKLETYLNRNGMNSVIPVNFNDEEVTVKIERLQRHVLTHNVMNIDTFEV